MHPRHLRHVYEALDARFDFQEGPVVGQAHDASAYACADREASPNAGPGIRRLLFDPQGDPPRLAIELDDDDLYLIPNRKDFGWMSDPSPRHVGDMQKAVDSAKVDEGTVVGNILDHSRDQLPFLECREGRLAFLVTGLFQ